MKNSAKIFLSILFLLTTFSFAVNAQTNIYHSFPDSVYWRVDCHYDKQFLGPCYVNSYFQYSSKGDTVINSSIYKKIYRSGVRVDTLFCYDPHYAPAVPPSGYMGALREDSTANKTFFVFANTSTDSLLYDYNLIIGDTLRGFIGELYFGHYHLAVLAIDSVLINGHYRKRWNFANDINNDSTYIIQGVGSSDGLIEPLNTYQVDLTYRNLICVRDSSINYFSSNAYSVVGCNLIYTGIAEPNLLDNSITLFPNPVSNHLTVVLKTNSPEAEIKIFNLLGELEYAASTTENKVDLDVSDLANGVHIIQIAAGDKISREKLIKQ
jgi:hypothetical protein